MPLPSLSTKMKLDGEAEYKRALSEIGSGLKVLKAELRLTTEEFAENADSVDALNAKNDVLGRQILGQKDKISVLQAALKNSANTYGESDKRTAAWQKSLYNAQTELIKMERAVKDNNDALNEAENAFDDVDSKTVGFGDTVGVLADKLGIHLPEGATKALNGIGGFNSGMVAATAGAASLVAMLVKVEKQLIAVTKEAAAWSGELHDLADVTGLTMQQLQEYEYAAELAGTTLDTMTGAQTKLIKAMQSAVDGTETQLDAFRQLGVAYSDTSGELRDTQEVFWDVVEALGQVENATQADSLAMELLGKSARDLNPLIKSGKENFEAYTQEARDMGLVLADEALNALDRVDEAMLRFDKTVTSAKNSLAAQFAPALEESTEKATDFIERVGDTFEETGVTESFGELLESASELLDPLASLIELLGPGAATAMKGTALTFALIADTLDAIVGVLTLNGDKIATALGWNTSSGKLSHYGQILYGDSLDSQRYDETLGAWVGNAIGSNASGTDNWRGGLTYINEAGPELAILPKGTQILTAQETRAMSGDTYYITIDAANVQEFNDIVDIVKNQQRLLRMGG